MFDANKILKSLTTGDSLGMAAKTGAGGALAGGLISALGGRKPKKIARTALTSGGLAAIAGLAYQAWRNHEQGKAATAAPPPPDEGELRQAGFLAPAGQAAAGPGRTAGSGSDPALLILEAMIHAARADGEVDADEHRLIQRGIAEGAFDAEEKAFLMDAFGQPVDLNRFAAKIGSAQAAMDAYTAAFAILDPPSLPERAHLDMLRSRLGLSEGVAQAIEAQVDAAAPRLAG
ncbi:MAG: DUF533 domain-containing protein [Sneathiellaceae bacterium]